ncbi:MAG TPA: porin [Nitrospiraceae bacterium]|nr:porin [Nitrospiraceae bacterium]
MGRTSRRLGGMGLLALGGLVAAWVPAQAGSLEDFLLENKQITIDQWVKLKAEEEKQQAKALEESRSVGDVPVRERWYEKISIRGYAQFRFETQNNSLLINDQGDRALGRNDQFSLRRARLIVSGQPHDRVFIYVQEEFAEMTGTNTANGTGTQSTMGNNNNTGTNNTPVLRDFYADLYLTPNKEWRIRAGQSKVPFGFETLQSSQNRLAFDRTDAINSAQLNERDVGLFLYYSPTIIRERFRRLAESGLKGSGDYGMLGLGVYNGNSNLSNTTELNKNKHVIVHSSYPHEFSNGQVVEIGMDAYTGQYVVSTTPVFPNSNIITPVPVSPFITNNGNYLDERVAWHFVVFPQPFGLQGEYTIGRGPQLNTERTQVEVGSLRGGYLQLYYNYQCDTYCLSIFPYIRWQEYFGGKKFENNAPRYSVRETEFGLEYQFNAALELTVAYSWTQRTSDDPSQLPAIPGASCGSGAGSGIACTQTPYQLQTGNLLRFQLQWNF